MPTLRSILKRTPLGKQIEKQRTISRNNRELGTKPSDLPFLSAYTPIGADSEGSLKAAHTEYVHTVSIPDAAASLETVYFIWYLLHQLKPAIILDLGSGFSSYIFRRYQREQQQNNRDCTVFSCDDNAEWLQRTKEYLTRMGVGTQNLLLWDDFLRDHGDLRPDLIFHDLGYPPVRVRNLARVLALSSPTTRVILDDVQKPVIRRAVLDAVREKHLRCYDLAPFTYDRFKRYSWLIDGVPSAGGK